MNIQQSRFACLNIDDDDNFAKNKARRPQPPRKEDLNNQTQTHQAKKDKEKDKKVSAPANIAKPKPKTQKQKALKQTQQWEEWKEKDGKIVDGRFEQDLESAILLSKIHYEENKDKYTPPVGEKKDKKQKKAAKKTTISLDQFLNGTKNNNQGQEAASNKGKSDEGEISQADFFGDISKEAKTVLIKDKLSEKLRERQTDIDEVISAGRYQEELRIEKEKNELLRLELEETRKEILNVKERNKTLYTLLSTGEMKGKAEVINELEKLTLIKDELTQEVSRLHCLLEQERSKVAALTTDKKKNKKHS